MTTLSRRYSRKGLTQALLAGCATGVMGSAAMAQTDGGPTDISPDAPLRLQTDYFGYAASVSGRVGFSDNITLQQNGLEDEEIVLSTAFSGGVITSTNSFTGVAMADLDLSYLVDAGDLVINQDVGGVGTATVADNWLYFDVGARSSRQLAGDNARFSANLNAGRDQRASVHTFAASPYLFHRNTDQSSVSLRYRYSQTFIDDSGTYTGGGFYNDSQSHEAIASFDSGNMLERVRFGVVGYGNRTEQDATRAIPAFGYDHASVTGDLEVAMTRTFSLSGAAGYDEVDTQDAAAAYFNDDDLSGFFWRAGFTARPHHRGYVRLQYGERYNDGFIDGYISYQLSKRLNFSAGANRSFQTRTQSNLGQYRNIQLQTLQYADRLRQGEEMSPRALINSATQYSNVLSGSSAQTVGVGVTDQAFGSLSGEYGRTTVTLSGNYADSDFGFRQIETIGANLTVSRQLSRRLEGYVGGNFRRIETVVDTDLCEANPLVFGLDPFDPMYDPVANCAEIALNESRNTTYIARVGAVYKLYENVSVFSEFAHSQRKSPVDFLEYGENYVYVGLKLDL